MGNVASCAPSITSASVVKVLLHTNGRLEIYPKPAKASDIMVQNPGQFLCHSCHLQVGQRIPGLCEDEELESGQLYFLLPMEMLYSLLTIEEMESLSEKTPKGIKQGSLKFSKIFPVFGDHFCLCPNSEENTGDASSAIDLEQAETCSRQRSWQPALETILET